MRLFSLFHKKSHSFLVSVTSKSSCVFYIIFILFYGFFIAFCTTTFYNKNYQLPHKFLWREHYERRTF